MSSALKGSSASPRADVAALPDPGVVAARAGPRPPALGRRGPSFSLRWIVPGVAASVLAGALVLAGSTWERDSQTVLVREVEARLLLEARHLALASAAALLEPYPELTLQPILRDLLSSRPDLESAVVLDHQGRIQGHAQTDRLGEPWSAPAGLVRNPATTGLRAGEVLEGDAARLVAQAPVRIASGEVVGRAILSMHRSYLVSAAAEARRRRTQVTLALIGVGTRARLVSSARLLRPVRALRHGIERLGRGDLETPIGVHDRTEFGMLAETLNHMAIELREAQRQSVEKGRLAREMELARSLQRSLLPGNRHQVGEFVLVGAQAAAAEVGGDYFDIVPLENDRVGFAIADVAGKGMGGCLVMTMVSALLRGLRDLHASPAALLAAIDQTLSSSLPRGGFVTMTYGTLEPETGRVTFASAGHLPALVFRASTESIEWSRAHAPPIGALRRSRPTPRIADETWMLGPGDLLVQLTDGYQEAPSTGTGESFEFARIEAVVRRYGAEGPEAVIRGLDEAVSRWTHGAPSRDDQTVLVVARSGARAQAVTHASMSVRELAQPLALLARLERGGNGLALEGRLEELPRIRAWLRAQAERRPLAPDAERMLESALYEACANVIEHGLAGRRPAQVDLWWMPSAPEAAPNDAPHEEVFVIRDRGARFDSSVPRETNFDDPATRKRGRGIGLTMIHRIMTVVAYSGGTPEGNVTVMRFPTDRIGKRDGGLTADGTA